MYKPRLYGLLPVVPWPSSAFCWQKIPMENA